MLAPATVVGHLRSCVVDAGLAAAVAHGRVLELEALGATGEGPWAVLDARGALLAVYERRDGERAKPAVVLTAPPEVGAGESGETVDR